MNGRGKKKERSESCEQEERTTARAREMMPIWPAMNLGFVESWALGRGREGDGNNRFESLQNGGGELQGRTLGGVCLACASERCVGTSQHSREFALDQKCHIHGNQSLDLCLKRQLVSSLKKTSVLSVLCSNHCSRVTLKTKCLPFLAYPLIKWLLRKTARPQIEQLWFMFSIRGIIGSGCVSLELFYKGSLGYRRWNDINKQRRKRLEGGGQNLVCSSSCWGGTEP